MSTLTTKTIEIMNMLPVEDQELLYSIAKKLVRAWDPDFTKLTPSEEKELKNSIGEISNVNVKPFAYANTKTCEIL